MNFLSCIVIDDKKECKVIICNITQTSTLNPAGVWTGLGTSGFGGFRHFISKVSELFQGCCCGYCA